MRRPSRSSGAGLAFRALGLPETVRIGGLGVAQHGRLAWPRHGNCPGCFLRHYQATIPRQVTIVAGLSLQAGYLPTDKWRAR